MGRAKRNREMTMVVCSECKKPFNLEDSGGCFKCGLAFDFKVPSRVVMHILDQRPRSLQCKKCGADPMAPKGKDGYPDMDIDGFYHYHGYRIPPGSTDVFQLSVHCKVCGHDSSFKSLGIPEHKE